VTSLKHGWCDQALFKNYDDTVLECLKHHVERLVNDTAHDTHETSQRCAAEIIAGLVRGCKHWNYAKVCRSSHGCGSRDVSRFSFNSLGLEHLRLGLETSSPGLGCEALDLWSWSLL